MDNSNSSTNQYRSWVLFSVNLIENTASVNVELRNNYIATRLIIVYNKR